MRRFARVVWAALAVMAGGVFTLDAADVSRRSSPAGASPDPAEAPAPFVSGVAADPGTVTLAFAGDVHFHRGLADRLRSDPASILGGVASVLSDADLAVVNLETAITERGRAEHKGYTFRAPARALDALAAGGVDVASMANNHAVDYGPDGLADSLAAAADSPVAVIGLGADATSAFAPYRTTIRGRRISVIAATHVLDRALAGSWSAGVAKPGVASALDPTRLEDAVRAARSTSDTVVVFLHWGIEKHTCPSAAQRDLAGRLVAAGADVVVGSHAHRLQGAGRLTGALVAYGLGNFAFAASPGEGTRSGVLLVDVAGRAVESYRWVPATIVNGVPHLQPAEAAAAAVERWERLRDCAGLSP